jgi:two-component system heavy metal sensor histidine kinase CusS
VDAFLRSKADDVVESIQVFWRTVDLEGKPLPAARRLDVAEDSPFFIEMAKLWTKENVDEPLLFNAVVEILDNKGKTIAASHALDPRIGLPLDLAQRVLAKGRLMREVHLDSGPEDQRVFRCLALPVRYGPKIVYVIQVSVTLSRAETYLARLRSIFFIFIPFGFAGALLAAWAGASSSVRPLRRMIAQIHRIGDRPAGQRLEEAPIAELAELAESFNTMLGRLERSFQTQDDFFNDVSHQLKTPLTVLKGEMELALRQDRDAATYRGTLLSGLEEVDRMSLLIGRMLALARLDSDQGRGERSMTEVRPILDEVAAALAPLAALRGVALRVTAAGELGAEIDAFRVREALSNLVDNAIAHSPRGATVDLELLDEGAVFSLLVRDPGEGVAPRDRDRLFTRFHRGEGHARPGYGIGLAFVKGVAELHGGRATYEPAEPGSVFGLSLPKIGRN